MEWISVMYCDFSSALKTKESLVETQITTTSESKSKESLPFCSSPSDPPSVYAPLTNVPTVDRCSRLGGLGLPGARRPSRRTAKEHPQRLRAHGAHAAHGAHGDGG